MISKELVKSNLLLDVAKDMDQFITYQGGDLRSLDKKCSDTNYLIGIKPIEIGKEQLNQFDNQKRKFRGKLLFPIPKGPRQIFQNAGSEFNEGVNPEEMKFSDELVKKSEISEDDNDFKLNNEKLLKIQKKAIKNLIDSSKDLKSIKNSIY